ncbi:hypothetical protein CHLRE_09g405800v5 [Chlamydomonas reinhardtii]|uniref:CBS domain-containing protein n=1 Tax=Chlamydomonas reinhardtii TaxID=3055 RepID=A8J820_CHLRE|nr:uncharacterized protein CHLRE_09g405800v5 [Chlamydomonas reinhardtii]PNW79198.1 hypothetical protein CHLRE_09g405800v5 [Chlamydomonas reinhardtii]|eukprot:XP_001697671.1 predicted protein [Chlamydomonas reinhardtii]
MQSLAQRASHAVRPMGPRRLQARRVVPRAASTELSLSTVKDVMSSGTLYSVSPEDTVDAALEILVNNRITGLPVLDTEGRVVGVVSDFDLLALDAVGRVNDDNMLFPSAEQSWQAFKEVKKMLAKTAGKKIKDVMTPKPITVRPETNLNDATSILISKKIRRLPVVDEHGKLVGLISRGNIVKAALAARKAAAASSN